MRDAWAMIITDDPYDDTCRQISEYIDGLLIEDHIEVETSDPTLSGYHDPVGGHSNPDIILGEEHLAEDGAYQVGVTLGHDAAHHVFDISQNDDWLAEIIGQSCMPE